MEQLKAALRSFAIIALLASLPGTAGCGDVKRRTQGPTAVITGDQYIRTGELVRLSGESSTDHIGLPLTYTWTLAEIPTGSTATLNTAAGTTTSFIADKGGYYNVELVVANSNGDSSGVRSFLVESLGTGGNHPPVAIATATAGAGHVILDGSKSYDVDGASLSYYWTVVNMQNGVEVGNIVGRNQPVCYVYTNRTGITLNAKLVVSDGVDGDYTFVTATLP